jgi:hypothetical protein
VSGRGDGTEDRAGLVIGAGESAVDRLVKDHVSAKRKKGRAVSEMRMGWDVCSAVEKIIPE